MYLRNFITIIFLYLLSMLYFYNQFIYIYLKPLIYFHTDNSLINIYYNELYNLNLFHYNKTMINYIPILELNLPLYITDTFYIKTMIYILMILLVPICILLTYIKFNLNLFKFENKEYSYLTTVNILNFIFLYLIVFYLMCFLLTVSLTHNNNMLLFEFDIQFNIQNYVYIYIYIISIIYIISLIKSNYIKYLMYGNIYYYIVYIILLHSYDLSINIFVLIIQAFMYFIYNYLQQLIVLVSLIKFYQTIIKRKI